MFKMETLEPIRASSDFRGMGVVNRPVRRLPSHPLPLKLKEVPNTVLRVDNKSGELKPTQVYPFMGYEYY